MYSRGRNFTQGVELARHFGDVEGAKRRSTDGRRLADDEDEDEVDGRDAMTSIEKRSSPAHKPTAIPPVIECVRAARALRAERRPEAALALIEARLRDYPGSVRLEAERLDLLVRRGRVPAAARRLPSFALLLVLRIGGRTRRTLLARRNAFAARLQMKNPLARLRNDRDGRLEERLEGLRAVRDCRRTERAALLDEARKFVQQKDLLRARSAWEALRERDPLDWIARSGLVRLFRQFGLHEQVEGEFADYARAIDGHPRRDLLLARVAAAGRMVNRASDLYEAALAQAPQDATAWRQAGLFYFREGLVARALRALEKATALGPGDEAARMALARLRTVLRLCGESDDPSPELRLTDMVIERLCATAALPVADPVAGRVMHVFPSFGPGGVQRQLLNLVGGMPRHAPQLERVVLLPMSDDAEVRFHRAAFDATDVEIAPALSEAVDETVGPASLEDLSTPEQTALLGHLPERLGREVAHIMQQIRAWRPEVVHTWVDAVNVPAGIAALLAGVPRIVLAARSSAPTGRRPAADYMRAAYYALLARPEVALTTVCRASAEEFRDWLDVPPERIATIYNGVDVDGLRAQRDLDETRRLRQELGIPEGAPVVGSAFRMNQEKRPILWIEAAAEVARARPDAHFVLLGDGVLREAVGETARRCGIGGRVHLPGLAQNVVVWLDMFDVVLLTSRYEGTANVMMEAQALGAAVVAPQVGGLAETFVPGETGLLLAPDPSASEVAAALLTLLGDPERRAALAARAEAFVRDRYGIDRAVQETLGVYGWLPGARRNPSPVRRLGAMDIETRPDTRALVAEARQLRQDKQWESALRVLAEAPSGASAVVWETVRNCLALQRYGEALALLDKHPAQEVAKQLRRLARAALGEGALDPDDLAVALPQLRTLEFRGATGVDYEALLRAAFAAAPGSFDVARRLVSFRPDEADAVLACFNGSDEHAAALWVRVAKARRLAGDSEGALEAFAAALALSNAPEIRLDAADTLVRQGRGREALVLLAPLRQDSDPAVLAQIARAHDAAQDLPGALACWSELLAKDPTNLPAMRGVARIHQTDKRLSLAFAVARQAARHPQRAFNDVVRASRLLRYMNRNAALDRFIRRSRHRYRTGRIGPKDFAQILLAADLPTQAQQILEEAGAVEQGDEEGRALYLKCLLTRFEYISAAEFLDSHPDSAAKLSRQDLSRIERARTFARQWGVADDQELHGRIIEQMLEVGRDPIFSYTAVPGKVLLTCSSLGLGGSERQTLNLAHSLAQGAGGATETAMLVNSQRGKSYELEAKFGPLLDMIYLKDLNERCRNDDLSRSPQFQELMDLEDLLNLNGTAVTARAFRNIRPEMLSYRVGPIAQTILASVIADVPHTLIQFGSMTRKHQSDGSELFDLRERIVIRACRAATGRDSLAFAANSRLACAEWAEEIGIPADHVGLIYNGLDEAALGDPDPERAAEVRAALRIPQDAFVVGVVFRFEPVKDPLLWMEVAQRLSRRFPECHFLLVGDGPLRETMLRMAENGGFSGRVHMPGAVFAGLRSYYEAMNVFVLTSRTESLPNVVIEAQIAGVPVVVTDAGGVREGIANEFSGQVARTRDPDELARLVQLFHDDPRLRERVAHEAPPVIRERFSIEQMVASTLRCFKGREPIER